MTETFPRKKSILDRLIGPVGTRQRDLYDRPNDRGVIDSVSCGIPISSISRVRVWKIEIYSTWKSMTAVYYSVGEDEIDIKYIRETVVKKYCLDPDNTCINRWYEVTRWGTSATPTPSNEECIRQKMEREYRVINEPSQN
jgi:hypothetical protein